MSNQKPARSNRRRDNGSLTIELVIALPVVIALMFIGVQAALYYYARTAAIAAAQEGARTAAGENGTVAAGVAAATDFVADAGGDDVLRDVAVDGRLDNSSAVVTVRGHGLSVIPGWDPTLEQSAAAPREELSAP